MKVPSEAIQSESRAKMKSSEVEQVRGKGNKLVGVSTGQLIMTDLFIFSRFPSFLHAVAKKECSNIETLELQRAHKLLWKSQLREMHRLRNLLVGETRIRKRSSADPVNRKRRRLRISED